MSKKLRYQTSVLCFILVNFSCVFSFEKHFRYSKNISIAGCTTNEDCIEHAACYKHNENIDHNYCMCAPGYIGSKTKRAYVCVKEVSNLGDPCNVDIQCSAMFGHETECRYSIGAEFGVCLCKPGAVFVNGICISVSKIGGPCRVSDNCPDYVYCVRGVCTCPFNKVPNADRTQCVKNSNLGEVCNEDRNCLNSNSRCYEGVCRCDVSHVANSDRNLCLELADDLGDKCKEDGQCTLFFPNSMCLDGTCQCNRGYHEHSNLCWISKGLNELCTETRQCISIRNISLNMHCSGGRCSCKNGLVPDAGGGECVPKSAASVLQVPAITILYGSLVLVMKFLINQ